MLRVYYALLGNTADNNEFYGWYHDIDKALAKAEELRNRDWCDSFKVETVIREELPLDRKEREARV